MRSAEDFQLTITWEDQIYADLSDLGKLGGRGQFIPAHAWSASDTLKASAERRYFAYGVTWTYRIVTVTVAYKNLALATNKRYDIPSDISESEKDTILDQVAKEAYAAALAIRNELVRRRFPSLHSLDPRKQKG